MTGITGINNELEFVRCLNDKKVKELNPMFRNFIDTLFPNVSRYAVIRCWKNKYPQKSDIFIKIDGVKKGISIKKGVKNSVHVERISDFIHFLIENNVDRTTIIDYLRYQYADGSTNGTGIKRLSVLEYKKNNQDSIDRMNLIFNNDVLLLKAIDRFIIKGKNSNDSISAIIHGEVDDFLFMTIDDIKKVVLSKKDDYSTAVHFGPITCQPKNRCLNYNSKYEKDRYCVQLKWYNLSDDIIESMNNATFNED